MQASNPRKTSPGSHHMATSRGPYSQHQWIVLACMYIGYGNMMISRQMVTILSPALLKDESLGFTVKDTGDILAFGTIGAMFGKVIWGPLADKIGGRLTFLLGIVLTGLLITAFGLSYNVLSFTIFAALAYGTKSSGWPGMTKIVANWFSPRRYGATWSILSTSSRASVVSGTVLFGGLLNFFDWRTVAFLSTAIALLVYILCQIFLKEYPAKRMDRVPSDGEPEDAPLHIPDQTGHALHGTGLVEGLLTFAMSIRFWLVVIMMMALTCAMAFLDFLPAYLLEAFGLTAADASMASAAMPIGSLIGLILAIFFYDRFSKNSLKYLLASCLAIATLCVVCVKFLPSAGLADSLRLPVVLCLVVLFGIMTSPAYYIPMSIFSIEFGGPHAATLVSIIDMFAFAASATFGFVAGRLAAGSGGWDHFMNLLIGIGLLCMISNFFFLQGEHRAMQKQASAGRGTQ